MTITDFFAGFVSLILIPLGVKVHRLDVEQSRQEAKLDAILEKVTDVREHLKRGTPLL